MPDVYRALWRHKWFVIVLTAILVGAAYFLTKQEQKHYQSSTLVRVVQRVQDPTQALGALQTGQKLAQTYAQIVETRAIAARIYERLDGQVPLAGIKVSASPVQDLDLLTITATATSPENAVRVANAAPRALRQFIKGSAAVQDQVISVQPAELPTGPSSPSLKLNLVLALMLGLILNGALALVLELVSDRLPDPEGIESLTGQPVIATIPQLKFTPGARVIRPRRHEVSSTIVRKVESG